MLTPCWWPRPGTGSTRPARFRRWPGCCGRAAGWAWCGTPATNGSAGCANWARSSVATDDPVRDRATLPEAVRRSGTPSTRVDELPYAASPYRSGRVTHLLHQLADRGAYQDPREGSRAAGHPSGVGERHWPCAALHYGVRPGHPVLSVTGSRVRGSESQPGYISPLGSYCCRTVLSRARFDPKYRAAAVLGSR